MAGVGVEGGAGGGVNSPCACPDLWRGRPRTTAALPAGGRSPAECAYTYAVRHATAAAVAAAARAVGRAAARAARRGSSRGPGPAGFRRRPLHVAGILHEKRRRRRRRRQRQHHRLAAAVCRCPRVKRPFAPPPRRRRAGRRAAVERLAVHVHDAIAYGNEAAGVGRPARLQNSDAVDAVEAEAEARRAAVHRDFVRLHARKWRSWEDCRAAAAGRGFVAIGTRGTQVDSGAPWVCVAHAPRLGQPARGRRGRHPRATSWRAGPELDLAAARPTPSRNDRALWRANTNVGAGPKDHRMAWPRLRTVCVRIGDLGAHAHAPKVGVEPGRHQVRHASRRAKAAPREDRGPHEFPDALLVTKLAARARHGP
eukprot:scaffold15149_cov76-Phaeocystis_antarctica.AAC.1